MSGGVGPTVSRFQKAIQDRLMDCHPTPGSRIAVRAMQAAPPLQGRVTAWFFTPDPETMATRRPR